MEMQGYAHPKFWRVAKVFEQQLQHIRGGAAACVYYQGEPVVDVWGGVMDAQGNPWKKDTLALSFSTTKGVTSTLIHILADRGLIAYDEPIVSYWPEFAAHGKETITMRHLLCHESGLYGIKNIVEDFEDTQDWQLMASRLAESDPAHAPGRASAYHAITYGWLLGEIAERVTGKTFGQLMEEMLIQPLKLDGLYIGVPQEQLNRVAEIIDPPVAKAIQFLDKASDYHPDVILPKNFPVSLRRIKKALLPKHVELLFHSVPEYLKAAIPSANGVFTARSLAKMYSMLAAGGTLDGVKLLSQRTIFEAGRIQSRKFDRVVPIPFHWRMGYHSIPSIYGFIPKAFGHLGLGGSGGWADPARNLSFGMVISDSWIGMPRTEMKATIVGSAAHRSV
ncbi:MAG: beta-lactamase family protein [SAR324 cluster bacterium]|nr:beta-lactamase family protein [SAR324 cluster bacterium]